MLVLSRQRDETIMIGDAIELTVVDIRGDKVRLGIKAPPQIPVHRKEVYDSIRQENQKAARVCDDGFAHLRPRMDRIVEEDLAVKPTAVDIASSVHGQIDSQREIA